MELRRTPHLVLYWQHEKLVLHNFAIDRTIPADPLVLQLLEEFSGWRTLAHYLDSLAPDMRETTAKLVQLLRRHGWLRERSDSANGAGSRFDAWDGWNPSAGFFHTATRNVRFRKLDEVLEVLGEQAKRWPMPSPLKHYPEAEQIPLPPASRRAAFPRTLRERRTWRRFGRAPVPLDDFSTLLHLTGGVQHWVSARGEGRVALKTSPSGGARHPIELYVLARRIRGLAPGAYHYAPDRHALERLPGSAALPPFDELLPTQWWYRDASALVFLTAVFERTRWRYKTARAYRAVLIEAGHLCQTFCLTATWLHLAPFCSMAIADSAAERVLGIDGISESVIYAAGVGTRPALRGSLPGALPRVTRGD